jgi:hypothetical protein
VDGVVGYCWSSDFGRSWQFPNIDILKFFYIGVYDFIDSFAGDYVI